MADDISKYCFAITNRIRSEI